MPLLRGWRPLGGRAALDPALRIERRGIERAGPAEKDKEDHSHDPDHEAEADSDHAITTAHPASRLDGW